jgi:hypothetical protein
LRNLVPSAHIYDMYVNDEHTKVLV